MKKKWLIPLIVLFLALYVLYFFVLVDIDRRPPSETWSKELMLIKDMAEVKNNGYAVAMAPDASRMGAVVLDGTTLHLVTLDQAGNTVQVFDHDFGDFARLYQLKLTWLNPQTMTLYGQNGRDLTKWTINLVEETLSEPQILQTDISAYDVHGPWLVSIHEEAFSLYHEDQGLQTHPYEGLNFAKIQATEGHLFVVASSVEKGDTLYEIKTDGAILRTIKIVEGSEHGSFGDMEGFIVEDHVLGVLYKQSVRKFGITYVHVVRVNLANGQRLQVDSRTLDLTSQPMQITQVSGAKSRILTTDTTLKGSNIVEYELSGNLVKGQTPLTATRTVNQYLKQLQSDDNQFVFWLSTEDGKRSLFLSSNHPLIIENTAASYRVNLVITFMTSLIGLAGSFLFLVIALVYVFLPGCAVAAILNQLTLQTKNHFMVTFVGAVVVHTGIKFYYGFQNLLQNNAIAAVYPPLFGNEPLLMGLVAVSSVMVLLATKWFNDVQHEPSPLMLYVFFGVVDLLAFNLIINVYIMTARLLGKL